MSLIVIIVVAIVGGSIYFALPFPIQLILLLINALVPDPIPFIDEIIMVGGIFSKLYTMDIFLGEFFDWLSEHKILGTIVVIGLLWLIFQLGSWLWNLIF